MTREHDTEVAEVLPAQAPQAAITARALGGERTLALLLRSGGILGGVCFLASLPLRFIPASSEVAVATDLLQKAGASFLIVTPIVRLCVAGSMLAWKGEWRYLVYAMTSVALLAAAVGARLAT